MFRMEKRNYYSFTVSIVCYLASFSFQAQTPDVLRIEYMTMPKNSAEIAFSRIKLVANIPFKVNESDNFLVGVEYNGLNFNLEQELPFDADIFKNLHIIDLNLAYIYRFNEDWRFIGVVTPRIASTLNEGLQQKDINLNVTVGAFKDQQKIEKPTRLVLGIAYNASVALRIPLPIVYYEKKFQTHWSYIVGVPKSGMKYHLNEKHLFQTEFILDGYYTNLQNSFVVPNGTTSTAISASAAIATFGYQYTISKNMFAYAYAGHTLFQDAVLRNEARKTNFILNDESSFYFRTGFRIGL